MICSTRASRGNDARSSKTSKRRPDKPSLARAVLDRPPSQGWITSDDDEIMLRRWRGSAEIVSVEALESEQPFYGTFRAQSGTGGFYEVEIRSLDTCTNSCGCIDHRVNGLGTCKHIEGVLAALRQRRTPRFRAAAAERSPRIEIFLDRRTGKPTIRGRRRTARRCTRRATGSRRIWRPTGRSPDARQEIETLDRRRADGAGRGAEKDPRVAPLRAVARPFAPRSFRARRPAPPSSPRSRPAAPASIC